MKSKAEKLKRLTGISFCAAYTIQEDSASCSNSFPTCESPLLKLAARYFPSIKHNHNNIHQNFPFITFTENDSILTMSQQHFGPTSMNSATRLHFLLLSVLLAFFH